jgi:hypothetical protein
MNAEKSAMHNNGSLGATPVATGVAGVSRLSRRTRQLIAVNGVLLALAVATLAGAQVASQRARGEYTMLSGEITTGGPQAIYIVDSANQEIVALRWDQGRQSLGALGYRNIASDAAAKPGR